MTVNFENIPPQLIINWDHTGIKIVPASNRTMEERGAKRVGIVGIEDKRQITTVLGCTLSGDFLPPQVIYGGKTKACLPKYDFPESWYITYTPKHWANKTTSKEYVEKIIIPYVEKVRQNLGMDKSQPASYLQCIQGSVNTRYK